MIQYPCYPADVKNATGAGDAFMAALVWAYLEGTELIDATAFASAAAAVAIESEETINPAMSPETVKAKMLSEQQIKEEK